MQPPMAPYAFHPGWAAPRKSVHDRITRPVRDRLSYNTNRSPQKYSKDDEKERRPTSPCAEISESSKQREKRPNVSSIIVGTRELKLKEPVVDESASSDKAILTIQPRSSANDHKASTSKAKPRDPKYT